MGVVVGGGFRGGGGLIFRATPAASSTPSSTWSTPPWWSWRSEMVWGGVCVCGGGDEREGERRGMRGDHPALHRLHPSLRPQHGPHLHGGPGGRRWCGEVGGGGGRCVLGRWGLVSQRVGRGGGFPRYTAASITPSSTRSTPSWCFWKSEMVWGGVCVCVGGGGGCVLGRWRLVSDIHTLLSLCVYG